MIKRDIEAFLTPIIEETGCELWGIEFGSAKGKGRLLRVYIDAIHGVDINTVVAKTYLTKALFSSKMTVFKRSWQDLIRAN